MRFAVGIGKEERDRFAGGEIHYRRSSERAGCYPGVGDFLPKSVNTVAVAILGSMLSSLVHHGDVPYGDATPEYLRRRFFSSFCCLPARYSGIASSFESA